MSITTKETTTEKNTHTKVGMELQKGLPLLGQQFVALFRKNLLLSWRNKTATCLQLFSSLFFLFLLFCIDKAFNSHGDNTTGFKTVRDPPALYQPPIRRCEDKFYVKLPCYDFVWSGNESSRVNDIVTRMMANNPGRPIPDTKVKSFRTPAEVDGWLLSNALHCPAAVHFRDINASVISYGLQTNSTQASFRGDYEDTTMKFQIPLQIAAEREMARTIVGDINFSWLAGLKEYAHPASEAFNPIATVGPSFFLAFTMFSFVLQIGNLVLEKELKLRQIGFAFMLSTFISKSTSATTMGFSMFIISFLTQARFFTGTSQCPNRSKLQHIIHDGFIFSLQVVTTVGFPYTKSFKVFIRFLWSLFPPNLLAISVKLLADATSTPEEPGVSWKGRSKCAPDDQECVITLNDVYAWLICLFLVWFALAIYFDNIFPNASGLRKSLFYFLKPGYWTGKGGDKVEEGGICSCMGSIPQLEHLTPDDVDVLEEENIVKNDAKEGTIDPNVAVQIRGLVKTYAGTTKIGCCKCRKTSPYHAVRGLWINFTKDQLFCLLGPNGAGKTTTISCLTGITPATGGDALVYGSSIRSSVGMSSIRKLVGVCPQFDILWDALSGREHLHLFANIKGLPPASIEMIAEESLAKVKLTESAKVRARSYSGGMRRRLSVAIALMGDPKLVILDEPTTGMDPISRRHVWDIIQNAKKGRSIVLTTHSMEEADILSDRIGIMAKGRLRCIGTSIRLKSRFGTGFIANVSFADSNTGHTSANTNGGPAVYANHEPVKQFFKYRLDVVPADETKSFLTFVIPHDREKLLTKFFAELEDRQQEFGISDIQLGLATLEEVFLNIAKQAELESAAAEGRLVTLSLTSGASVQIPVGARFVGIPGTESPENPRGIMVEVYWEQDDSGALCISGHSAEMPIPRSVQQMATSVPPSSRSLLGRSRGPVYGIVIDPNQIVTTDDY
ncbi:ATP-binding cassette sub- A member 2 [Turnera subulata]|uniref:ATP-binding cassette sub- A member 2 n=1 Tax=Turnera subulata TaxID=218843 RepID=A0A9Q0F341_9ROSI|nr:ATP-binding cassette sub- A member 2 [Turnera subulata]